MFLRCVRVRLIKNNEKMSKNSCQFEPKKRRKKIKFTQNDDKIAGKSIDFFSHIINVHSHKKTSLAKRQNSNLTSWINY